MAVWRFPSVLTCLIVACAGPRPVSVPTLAPQPAEAHVDSSEKLEVAPSPATEGTRPSAKPPNVSSSKEEDARRFLEQFVRPSANHAMLTKTLRPTSEDYGVLYDATTAAKLDAAYAPEWDSGRITIAPRPGQTEVKVWSATAEDLRAGKGNSREFPGGYARVAEHLAPGAILYRFKFVEPGKDLGVAFDGLAYVNSRWVIIPKPWRVLGSTED